MNIRARRWVSNWLLVYPKWVRLPTVWEKNDAGRSPASEWFFWWLARRLKTSRLVFHDKDLFALVLTAVQADPVRPFHLAAVGARDQVGRGDELVRSPAIPPSLG